MIRKILVVGLIALLIGQGTPSGLGSDPVDGGGEYVSRSNILIATDADFTAENGVVGGSGSFDDPYRISGWHIVQHWDWENESASERIAITIGYRVLHSYYVIENNIIELVDDSTIGIAIGTNIGGTIRNNVISTTGVQTLNVGLMTPRYERQDPFRPSIIEGNVFLGVPGMNQIAIGFSGTSAWIIGNQFVDILVGVNVAGAYTTGPQLVRIEQNDFVGVDWAIPALAWHGGTGSFPVIDARDNYYGHPEGPTWAMCISLGCYIGPLGEKGAKVAPNVLAHPYAEEPFFN